MEVINATVENDPTTAVTVEIAGEHSAYKVTGVTLDLVIAVEALDLSQEETDWVKRYARELAVALNVPLSTVEYPDASDWIKRHQEQEAA